MMEKLLMELKAQQDRAEKAFKIARQGLKRALDDLAAAEAAYQRRAAKCPPEYERLFVTRDRDATFNLIEDEDGGLFWGYGHRDANEFIAEVNRWIVHVDGDGVVWEESSGSADLVEHLWARMADEHGERFVVVEPASEESDAGLFPVTRLML